MIREKSIKYRLVNIIVGLHKFILNNFYVKNEMNQWTTKQKPLIKIEA